VPLPRVLRGTPGSRVRHRADLRPRQRHPNRPRPLGL